MTDDPYYRLQNLKRADMSEMAERIENVEQSLNMLIRNKVSVDNIIDEMIERLARLEERIMKLEHPISPR
jgi:archaellum component FlaC